jgi:DNA repair exonuclease SbcCD ATPase subunit
MHIVSITIENFLSIEKAHIDFDDAGLLLFEGWNHDTQRANGAGKTAILNALSYALYDNLPRKITASQIVRRGANKGSVVVKVKIADKTFICTRSRPKGFSVAVLADDGTTEILNITQQEWESKLKLSYNQFIVSAYCAQGNTSAASRFILLNDTDKKTFLLELLNLGEFNNAKKYADDKVQSIYTNITKIEQEIVIINSRIASYSESLVDVATQTAVLDEFTEELSRLKASLNTASSATKPDVSKIDELLQSANGKLTDFVKKRTQREMLFSQWQSLGRKIKPFSVSDSCTLCGASIDNTQALSHHEKEVSAIKADQLTLKCKLDELDTHLLGESKVKELVTKLLDKKQKELKAYQVADASIRDIHSSIRLVEHNIASTTKRLAEDSSLRQKIDLLQQKRDLLNKTLSELAHSLELQKTVASIYSPTGAQAYVLDSAVNLFNEHMAKHVSALWPNLTYELQSYKENVKGDVTAKFSESIVMDGKPISIGSLSGGELKALSICADMSLLGILEQQFGISVSPVIFDEAFDGLDTSGKEFALDLIKGLSQTRQVIVIDHASEMRAAFDKVIRVEKRDGISAIV